MAWYGLALSLDEYDKKVYCLKKVVGLNPSHQKAQQLLEKLVVDKNLSSVSIKQTTENHYQHPVQKSVSGNLRKETLDKSTDKLLLFGLIGAGFLMLICGLTAVSTNLKQIQAQNAQATAGVIYLQYTSIPNTPNVVPKSTTRPNPTSTPITQPNSSIPPRDADMYTISYESSSWFGCSDREYFSQIVKYIVDEDKQAAEQALNVGIYYGECTIFGSGEQVYLTGTAIFSGLVKIRRKGETQEFWTYAEAVVSNH